jgi:hypothetical protein
MRVRPVPLLVAIFGSAAASAVLVASQLSHEEEVRPAVADPSPAATPATAAGPSEPLGAIEGLVASGGRPVPGAAVRAASGSHGATGRTDADGRFRLAVPAGSYVVQASIGDLAGAADGSVTVAAGATARGADVRLGPGAAAEGTVLRGDGAAAGAEVVLLVHDTEEVAARVVAGPDGRFAVGGLAPGAYDLRASAPGASPARLPGVTLAAGTRFPLRIALPGTGAVLGTVRDPAGRALAGVRVRAAARGDGLAGAPPLEVRTDFEGRFRLDALEVGRAELVAREEGVAIGVAQAARVTEGRASVVELVLPEAGLLAGRVRDGGRPPPPGTIVVATAMRGTGTLQVARAAADARGDYRLALPAGEYRVHAAPGEAAHADVRVAPAFARVEPRRATALDLAPAPVAPAAGIELLVLEPGGAPSPGAIVTLSRPDDGRVALATSAGEDGRAVVAGEGIAGREVTIRARNGGRTVAATLTLPAAGTVPLRLAPGGAVEGVVRGAGPSGFTVEVSSQPAAGAWRTVDVHRFAGDRFELGDLPAEPLRIAVRADDGRRATAEVQVVSGETRALELALR